jgi:hypothetical protein
VLIVREYLTEGVVVVDHPGLDPKYRSATVGDVVREGKSAAERDADIVAESRLYVAAPYSLEPHPKSGVWANIKRAEAAGVPTIILAP